MIQLDTVAQLARSLSVKREKQDEKEVVVCTLRISDAFITREQIDEFVRQPIGWHSALFDELGAPIASLELVLPASAWSIVGRISGSGDLDPVPTLNLLEAKFSGVSIGLTKLGGKLAGTVTWTARGDEVEDLTDILGALVKIVWRVGGDEQLDLLKKSTPELVGQATAIQREIGSRIRGELDRADAELRDRLAGNSKRARRARGRDGEVQS